MDERSFQNEQRALLEGLRRSRGDCPEPGTLALWSEGRLASGEHEAVAAHLELCPVCRETAAAAAEAAPATDEIVWTRVRRGLDRRPAPWEAGTGISGSSWRRRRIAFAAAATIVLAAGLALWQYRDASLPPPAPVVRGVALEVLEPIGAVHEIGVFAWNPLPLEVTYRVEVQTAGGRPVWEGRSAEAILRATEELDRLLEPGRTYRWRVVAESPDGERRAASDWVEFSVATRGEASGPGRAP